MRYILTSSDVKLRNLFDSDAFCQNNYYTDYNQVTKECKSILRLPGNITPVVGDYLYFIDNYYNQIPLKVVRLAYGAMSTCMIWCEKAELWEIDPFIYAGAPNPFHRKYTYEFEDKITHTAWTLRKKFPEFIEKAQKECGDENVCELGVIVREIIRYTGVDNTCIDYTNVTYAVCEILQKNGFEQAKDWHRPEKWEYSGM